MEEARAKAKIMRFLKRFIAREVFLTLLGSPAISTAAANYFAHVWGFNHRTHRPSKRTDGNCGDPKSAIVAPGKSLSIALDYFYLLQRGR